MLTACETDLLRRLAETPFADRLDLAALSGWSRGAVYAAMDNLKERGMADAIPHAAPLLPPTRRYCLTAAGLQPGGGERGRRPWTTCCAVAPSPPAGGGSSWSGWTPWPSSTAWPPPSPTSPSSPLASAGSGPRRPGRRESCCPAGAPSPWCARASPPTAPALPSGSGGCGRGRRPAESWLLTPDEVRLRQARRMLAGAPFPVFLALERDAALAGLDSPVWRPPSVAADLDLRYVLSHLDRGGWVCRRRPLNRRPGCPPASTWTYPPTTPVTTGCCPLLGPAEKRVLDLLSDWPWASKRDLAGLMGVSDAAGVPIGGGAGRVRPGGPCRSEGPGTRRLVPSDRGLALLARRDRTSVGTARRRWSVAPLDPQAPLAWRNVSGSRSRQLLRNVEHTGAVHWFLAALARNRPAPRRLGGGAARPAPPRVPLLPLRRRFALGAARRLRRPAPGR